MIEHPILFSAPMVRAILNGTKTQTRRMIKPQPPSWANKYYGSLGTYSGVSEPIHYWEGWHPEYSEAEERDLLWPSSDKWSDEPQWDIYEGTGLISPYGSEKNCIKPASQLWVRETHMVNDVRGNKIPESERESVEILYKATDMDYLNNCDDTEGLRWAQSIYMPRWASRIQLEITNVRVERLNEINADDAIAEGIFSNGRCYQDGHKHYYSSAIDAYKGLWEQINGAGSWSTNPWVWVVEFKKVNHGKT